MTERAFPFDAGPGADSYEDRWQKMARRWLATGVIPAYLSSLVPSANGTAMAVAVATGGAWVEGFYYETDAPLSVALTAAHASLPRIDRIVVRLDRTANTITVAALTGTPSSSPTAPTLTQTDTLWEMLLADVLVPAAAGVIVAGNVTDRRTLTGDARVLLRSQFDAKGDLLVGTADDTFIRKPVGIDGQALVADAASPGGLKWGVPTLGDGTGWHVVGVAGEPPFASGWSAAGSPYAPPRFRKDASGFVHLDGVGVSTGASAVIFTLPAGYWPDHPTVLLGSSTGTPVTVQVAANGDVSTGSTTGIVLSGISFYTG